MIFLIFLFYPVLAFSIPPVQGYDNWHLSTDGLILQTGINTKSGPGAIPTSKPIVGITTTGAGNAMTLADGVLGQDLLIIHTVDGGDAVVTPANLFAFTTLNFAAVGDVAHLRFISGFWFLLAIYGATVTP